MGDEWVLYGNRERSSFFFPINSIIICAENRHFSHSYCVNKQQGQSHLKVYPSLPIRFFAKYLNFNSTLKMNPFTVLVV